MPILWVWNWCLMRLACFLSVDCKWEFRIWLLLCLTPKPEHYISWYNIGENFQWLSLPMYTLQNYSLGIFYEADNLTRITVDMKKDITQTWFLAWIWCFGESVCLHWRNICVRGMGGNVVVIVWPAALYQKSFQWPRKQFQLPRVRTTSLRKSGRI